MEMGIFMSLGGVAGFFPYAGIRNRSQEKNLVFFSVIVYGFNAQGVPSRIGYSQKGSSPQYFAILEHFKTSIRNFVNRFCSFFFVPLLSLS